MKTTDFCPYELSKKLKECGFNEPCSGKYVDCPKDPTLFHGMEYQPWNLEKDEVIAPSLYEAQKWLREKKGFFVEVTSEALHDWDYFILELDEDVNAGLARGKEIYESYEQALSAGISASLQLIEKGE